MKLLLDSHIKRAVVEALRRRAPHLEAVHLAHWRRGTFLDAADADILAACYEERRVWLTYDQQTIPDLLRQWAADERPHAGVFFADRNTVSPNDVGALAAAITELASEIGASDTTNLVRYLRPPRA